MAINPVNSKIKQFDTELGNYINAQIADGIDISTVVLILDKYLLSAKAAEADIIRQEQEQIQREMAGNAPVKDAPRYDDGIVDTEDEDTTGPGSIENTEDEDTPEPDSAE